MKQIYSARNEVDAHLAKAFLAEAGIETSIQSGALSNVIGELPVDEATLPSLWVRDDDVDRAMTEMERFLNPQPPEGDAWKCPGCGETVAAQFTDCWKCNTARPA